MAKTKDRILSEAERLFANKGYDSTSIREIVVAAEVNLAAIHYHFGSKEALFLEIIRRQLEKVNQKRVQLLEKAMITGQNENPSVRAIVTAFLIPINEMEKSEIGSKQFSIMLGRAFTEKPNLKHKIYTNFFKEIGSQFIEAFRVSLPEMSREELLWRFHFMISTMVGALMAQDRLAFLSNGQYKSDNLREMINRMIDFVVAGMESKGGESHEN